jgi:hypothetical protein
MQSQFLSAAAQLGLCVVVLSTAILHTGVRTIGDTILTGPPFGQRLWLIWYQNQKALHLLGRYIFNRTDLARLLLYCRGAPNEPGASNSWMCSGGQNNLA